MDKATVTRFYEPIMFAEKGESEVNGEIVLNNNDNWIPDTLRYQAFTNPERWQRHLRTYLDKVPNLFVSEMERINQLTPLIDYRIEETLNLHSAETYWEFTSENPTALVASLSPLLNSFCRQTASNSYPNENDHNAVTLSAQINPGRAIRIYAKTTRRIRVEVIHTFGSDNGFRIEGGHTSREWDKLPHMLNALAEDAAILVNQMFTHFRSQKDVIPSHVSAYQLILEICECSRDTPLAITITSLLIHKSSVAAGGGGEKMQRALHRLREAGVITYDTRSKIYVATATHRHALETLQRHGNFSLLIARVRRRPNLEV